MAKKISQSDTRWVKKPGQRGYVEQISTGKRVTGKVKLSTDTTTGKAGQTRTYSKGRDVTSAAKPVSYRAPATSNGAPKTSTAGPVGETKTLPGGMSTKQAAKFVAFKAGTEGRRSGTGGVPSSLKPPTTSAKGPQGGGFGTRTSKARNTSSYQAAQKKVSKSRTAASRQSAVRTYARFSNPVTAPGALAQFIAPKSAAIQKAAFRKVKNWWEGG